MKIWKKAANINSLIKTNKTSHVIKTKEKHLWSVYIHQPWENISAERWFRARRVYEGMDI